MKQRWLSIPVITMALALVSPVSLLAQKDDKQDEKDKKDKETQQIIIMRKSAGDEKVTVEIKGDKITINGKPAEEYKNKDGDVSVTVNHWKDMTYLRAPRIARTGSGNNIFFTDNEDKPMLGVNTEKADNGVEVISVTKESGAEKAGIKEKDIITKIDDQKVEDPDDLSTAVQKHKAGDKITVTLLRDNKEQKVTAELTKWKGMSAWTFDSKNNFNFNMDDVQRYLPKTPMAAPLIAWAGNGPKLGLSIQDNDEGKGVKVTDVDDESNAAKAGIKEDDIITEADGKTINNADDMVKVIRESREKTSIMLKIQRAGKTQNVEVKMPRRLRKADL